MSFLGNLMGGLSAAAGSQYGVDVAEKNKQRRELMSDQVLQFQTDRILGDVKQAQARLGDPNITPEDRKHWEDRLQSFQQAFVDLYHPEKNPGALSKLGGYLRKHVPGVGRIPGMRAPAAPATPAAAKQSLAELESGLWAPPSMDDNLTKLSNWARDYEKVNGRPPNADEKKDAWDHISMGAPYREKAEKQTWTPFNVTIDGKETPFLYNPNAVEGEVQWKYPNGTPVEQATLDKISGFMGKPGKKPQPKKGWSKDTQGNIFSQMLDENNQPIPNTQNYNDIPPGDVATRIREGTWHYTDKLTGAVTEVGEETSTTPQVQQRAPESAPPTGPTPTAVPPQSRTAPNIPQTPAQARHQLRPGESRVIGHTTPEGAGPAIKAADTLETDVRTVNSYYKDRKAGHKSAFGDKGIVYAWVRSQVHGAGRMTNPEIDNAYRTGGLETRFKNAMDNAINGTLDDTFIDQAVTEINREYQSVKATADKYRRTGTAADKTHVSMKKAMALPQNKGKTKEEVRREIVGEKLIPIEDAD